MAKIDDEILSEGQNAKLVLYQKLTTRINEGDHLNAQEIKRWQELHTDFERGRDETEICKTIADAARYADVNERKIRYGMREAKRNKLRQNADGTFDKSEIDRWLAHSKPTTGPAQKDDPDRRYRVARAKEKELIVRRLRAELIPVEEVKKIFADRAHEFAKALDLLARRISLRVAGRSKKKYQEVFEIIESECHAILGTYSRPGGSLSDNDPPKRTG